MADPHSQIRQTQAELRQGGAGETRASRNARFANLIFRHHWVQVAGFSCATGLFLSFVAAFGTAGMPLLPRTGMFLAYSLYGGTLAAIISAWTRRRSWVAARPGMQPVVVAAIMTVLMAISVGASLGIFAPNMMTAQRAITLLLSSLVMSATMTAVASASFRPARFTHARAGAAAEPRFLTRLPLKLRGAELWAIQAEDHYLRLHTSKGEELILMRLTDAIAELDGVEGAQIHRSWWVARVGVSDIKRGPNKIALVLPNGTMAPVSRTYAPTLRKAGWL